MISLHFIKPTLPYKGRGSCAADIYTIVQESLSAFSGDVREQRPSGIADTGLYK